MNKHKIKGWMTDKWRNLWNITDEWSCGLIGQTNGCINIGLREGQIYIYTDG